MKEPSYFLTLKQGSACWIVLEAQLQILNAGCWFQIQEASTDIQVKFQNLILFEKKGKCLTSKVLEDTG